MGSQNSTPHQTKRRTSWKKFLRFSSTNSNVARPVSYAGLEFQSATLNPLRPLSMFDVLPSSSLNDSAQNNEEHRHYSLALKSDPLIVPDPDRWQSYLPLTLEKIRQYSRLKELIYQKINHEFCFILNRLLRLDRSSLDDEFLHWFFDEFEIFLHFIEDNADYQHPSLLLRSIEQDRFDCMKILFEREFFPSKFDVNTINDQGRHCLLILAHKDGPKQTIEYLLTHHSNSLDLNKLDFHQSSALHHTCRHFNLVLSQLFLKHIDRTLLKIENSELHTPTDYWLECLCSLKKLKPTHLQHHSDALRLDHLLDDAEYQSNLFFFQNLINHGGQLTKIPLRYIRSILPQLTFEQKLAYVDHHVNLCCTFYKNRLSTMIRDYDNLKISIQAGEILTEFIYALGRVQLEVQNRFAAQIYENGHEANPTEKDEETRRKDQEILQSTMRMLYFKFFRLFQCIYSNPDVNVKNFHYEHIFRRVWIYWKEPVRAFLLQCRERNSTLKSQCRILIFKHLNHYPSDIRSLPLHKSLKEFLTFDNQFFSLH